MYSAELSSVPCLTITPPVSRRGVRSSFSKLKRTIRSPRPRSLQLRPPRLRSKVVFAVLNASRLQLHAWKQTLCSLAISLAFPSWTYHVQLSAQVKGIWIWTCVPPSPPLVQWSGSTCSNGLSGIDGANNVGDKVCCPVGCNQCGEALTRIVVFRCRPQRIGMILPGPSKSKWCVCWLYTSRAKDNQYPKGSALRKETTWWR